MEHQKLIDHEDSHESYKDDFEYPDNMPDEVEIEERNFSVFEWLRKLRNKQLIIDPEFQRKLVWKDKQRSRFIESILLNLPLPALYVNQNIEGKLIIVDGLQRTMALTDFLKDDGFKLRDLELRKELNGQKFKGLSPKLQARIEDKNLSFYIIKPRVPIAMVYDIFNRINTGGTQLSRQEIRNCLFIGKATRLLKELSEEEYFRKAIHQGISDERMRDREAILRFLAFKILGYQSYRKKDMDEFLNEALRRINKMKETEIQGLKEDFRRVMSNTYEFFGEKNFRLSTENSKGRINIALLEAIGYFFAMQSDAFLQKNKQVILENYEKLLKEENFIEAVRYSTDNPKQVKTRFELVEQILGDVDAN